ncbi:predicted protein, partial [Nematostella vectensis]
MTASSHWNSQLSPTYGRLHLKRAGNHLGSWSARHNNHNQWLQIDLGRAMKVTGIATQGRQDFDQWVTSYWVKYSMDGVYFSTVRECILRPSLDATFVGNHDRKGVMSHAFRYPIFARYVRIHPRGWRSHISMRVELYG